MSVKAPPTDEQVGASSAGSDSPLPGWYEIEGKKMYYRGEEGGWDLASAIPVQTPAQSGQVAPQQPASGVGSGLIAAGWVFSFLLPLLGVILGVIIMGRQAGTRESSGKWIIGVSIGMMVLGVIVAVASSSGGGG